MYQIFKNRRFSVSCLVALLACSPLSAEENLTFDPGVSVSFNGTKEVQRIFGGVVNGSTRDEGLEYVRDLNLNSLRAFAWGPGRPGQYFKTPWYSAQYGGTPVSREEAFAKWDAFFESGNFPQKMEDWWEASKRGDQLYQFELFKKWDVTEGIVLHTELDGSTDRHPEAVNQYYQEYLNIINRKAPWVEVDFVQFQNEPNYAHWSAQFETTEESVDTFIRTYNRLDTFLREQGNTAQLLGPCLSTSAFCSWSGWRDWTLPVLERFHHIDFYNYQLYGKGAGEHLAWVSMLQAAGEEIRGVRPKAVITETNLTPSQIEASKSFRWEAEQLFMAMENPDKFALRTYFLLAYPNLKTREPRRTTNLLTMQDGELLPTAVYWVYWVLSQTRGEMIWIDAPSDSSLKAMAVSSPKGSEVVSLFNHSDEPQSVRVKPADAAGYSREVTQRIAFMDGEESIHEESNLMTGPDGTVTVELPPYAVCALEWSGASSGDVRQSVEHKEYFAKETALKLNGGETLDIAVDELPTSSEVAFVRLGITTDDVLMAKSLEFTLNGKPYSVLWSAQPKNILSRFGGFPNTWCVEMQVPRELIEEANRIEIQSPDASYRLMFASIVTREFPSEEKAEEWDAQTAARSASGVSVGLDAPANLTAGEQFQVELNLRNTGDREIAYKIAWELPEALTLDRAGSVREVKLDAGEGKGLSFTFNIAEPERIEEGVLKVLVTPDGGKARSAGQNVRIFPALVAGRLPDSQPMSAANYLATQDPAYVYENNGVVVTSRFAWDQQNLYMLVLVAGDFTPEPCQELDGFWRADSIEAFMDLGNEKNLSYDKNDTQLFFCPRTVQGTGPIAGRVGRIVRDDSVDYIPAALTPKIEVRSLDVGEGNGYELFCIIPWSELDGSFAPSAGTQIGFDLGINRPGSPSFSDSVVGSQGKRHDRPASWSVLTLK